MGEAKNPGRYLTFSRANITRGGLGGRPFKTSGRPTFFFCGKKLDLVSTVRTSWQLNFVKTVFMHSGQLRNPQYVRRLLLAAVALGSHFGQSNKVERLGVAARRKIPMYTDNT